MSIRATERRLVSTVVLVIGISIAGEFPDWHLIILGEGPDRADPEARAIAAGIGERAIRHGWITEPSDHFRRILVEPGGVEGVASGLRARLQDEGARAHLAAHAPRVREQFDLESVLDRGVDVAAGVLRRRGVTR